MEFPNDNHPQNNQLQDGEYWEKMYREFLDFRRKKSSGMPPSVIKHEPNPLYQWVQQQHQFKSFLSTVQLAKLQAARFTWATKSIDPIWEEKYREFLEFRKTHPTGMPKVEINQKRNPLYVWCDRQRRIKDRLDYEQLAKLKEAGFEWETPMKVFEEGWEKNFRRFVEFKSVNPDIMPPALVDGKITLLYLWCTSQKQLLFRLGPERRKRLMEAGFDKDKIEKTSAWERRFFQFAAWRNDNPKGMPPKIIDGQMNHLQEWCRDQIKKKDKNQLSAKQINQLNDAGFVWHFKDLDAAWEKKYEEFLEFRNAHPKGMPQAYVNGKVNPLCSWITKQREQRYKLSPERLSKLMAADFEWEKSRDNPKEAWEKRYYEFVEFKKKHPKIMPPCVKNDKEILSLYTWCNKQRLIKSKLSEIQRKKLDNAGFVWEKESYRKSWEENMKLWEDYVNANPGKIIRESNDKTETYIYKWIERQRLYKGTLTKEQVRKLNDAGFDWKADPEKEKQNWEKWYAEYLKFREQNPQGLPPPQINGKKNPVYSWCSRQIAGKHALTEEQISKLNAACFDWIAIKRQDVWEINYLQFLEFRKQHPSEYPVSTINGRSNPLYEWCRTQRKNKTNLTPDQIEKLDDAGFKWKVLDFDEEWNKHYQEYLEFRKKNPKGMPTSLYKGKANPLHNWCRVQQRFKNKLSADKINKLDDAGFDWFVFIPDWNEYYKEFVEFRNSNNKGMPENSDSIPQRNLFKWCQEQRDNKELLPPEYVEKLDAEGFEWE